jgi:hypothetical protein
MAQHAWSSVAYRTRRYEGAERIANKLAEGSKVPAGRVVAVKDEHGNVVGKVPVPSNN